MLYQSGIKENHLCLHQHIKSHNQQNEHHQKRKASTHQRGYLPEPAKVTKRKNGNGESI